MKNNIKIVSILIIFFALFILSAYYLATNNFTENSNIQENDKDKNKDEDNDTTLLSSKDYLVVNNTDLWKFQDNNWINVKDFNNIKDLKFHVYENVDYIGEFYLQYVNKWLLLDSNGSVQDHEENILAFTRNLNIVPKNFNIVDINEEDLEEINNILETNFSLEEVVKREKVVIDLNKDGIDDKLINVSNIDMNEKEAYFNLIYVVVNDDINILIKENIKPQDVYINPLYKINYVLIMNDNLYDSILIGKDYNSFVEDSHSLMYQYIDGTYQKVI